MAQEDIDPLDPTDDPTAAAETPEHDVPPVTISPTIGNYTAAGGTGDVTVTITGPGASGTWICTKDSTADWLTFQPATPQAADGFIDYQVAVNTTAMPRVAHLYCNGKTFTVNQAG